MRINRFAAVAVGAVVVAATGLVTTSAAYAAPTAPQNALIDATGTYYPVNPVRVLDTRTGNGAPARPVGPQGVINLQVGGRGGVPTTGVGAVVLNVTVTGSTHNSFVTVYPAGVARPIASTLNFPPNWSGANSATVPLGTNGRVDLFNNNGSVHIIADVVGFYAQDNTVMSSQGMGGEFQPSIPERLFDSRTDWGSVLDADNYVRVPVSYGPEIDPHIRALAVNITAVTPRAAGYLTAWSGADFNVPTVSTLNYSKGAIVPNLAIVPVSTCYECGSPQGYPSIGVYTSRDTHVIVDIVGFIDDSSVGDGLRFKPLTPTRIVDSRVGQGAPGILGPGSTATITTPDALLANGTEALSLNVTAVAPTGNTHLVVWPDGFTNIPMPTVSNLNPSKGQVVANGVISLIGPENKFNIYNNGYNTHVVADVMGTYYPYVGDGTTGAGSRAAVDKSNHKLQANQPAATKHKGQ